MPRVSNKDHYQRHLLLRTIWQHREMVFSVLTVHAQQELHQFYQQPRSWRSRRSERTDDSSGSVSPAWPTGPASTTAGSASCTPEPSAWGYDDVLSRRMDINAPLVTAPTSDPGRVRMYFVARTEPDLDAAMNAILFDLDQDQGV